MKQPSIFHLPAKVLGAFVLIAGIVVYIGSQPASSRQTGAAKSARPGKQTPLYDVIDLGDLAGRGSDAEALNLNGEVVGSALTRRSSHAFHWKQGKMVDLGPGATEYSWATGINNSGLIVGDYFRDERGPVQAVQWKDGKMTRLPLWQGSKYSDATSINASGQIVGRMVSTSNPRGEHACLWEGNKIIDLGMLPHGGSSGANKINARGQIVGDTITDQQRSRACLWDHGKVVDVGPPHSENSLAMAINDAGVIAGYFQGKPDEGGEHAFLYRNGTITDLGGLPHSETTVAMGINNSMEVVGISVLRNNNNRAFLWSQGKMVDLNDCIGGRTGWTLQVARAINNRGEIVSVGTIKGKGRDFLLKPHTGRAQERSPIRTNHPTVLAVQ